MRISAKILDEALCVISSGVDTRNLDVSLRSTRHRVCSTRHTPRVILSVSEESQDPSHTLRVAQEKCSATQTCVISKC